MNITLQREKSGPKATIGELLIEEKHECFTLEDIIRKVKVDGQTAIPPGTYEVIINWSDRFKRLMPLLLNVPGFAGIRIHSGNTDKDTEGCILLGQEKVNADFIGHSVAAFSLFFLKLQSALQKEKVFITVKGFNG